MRDDEPRPVWMSLLITHSVGLSFKSWVFSRQNPFLQYQS